MLANRFLQYLRVEGRKFRLVLHQANHKSCRRSKSSRLSKRRVRSHAAARRSSGVSTVQR